MYKDLIKPNKDCCIYDIFSYVYSINKLKQNSKMV